MSIFVNKSGRHTGFLDTTPVFTACFAGHVKPLLANNSV